MKKQTIRVIRKSTKAVVNELIINGTDLKIAVGGTVVTQERYNQECKTIAKKLKEFPNDYEIVVIKR